MSYTRIVTFTKTSQTPANAFETMPTIDTVATPEQIAELRDKYPSQWSIRKEADFLETTTVYADESVWNQSKDEAIPRAVWELRKQWITDNHIIETVQTV